MNRHEKVGLGLVGDFCTTVQFYKYIGLTCVDHFHIRAIMLHHPTKGQGKLQREVLFLRDGAHSTSIATTMTSINHQRKLLAGGKCSHRETHQQYEYDIFLHQICISTPAPSQSAPIGGFFFINFKSIAVASGNCV